MNKTNAHLYLPLVQALADGKTIQQLDCGEWVNFDDYAFTQDAKSYRIKPKPLEIKIWVDDSDNTPLCHPKGGIQRTDSLVGEKSFLTGATVHLFREVIK